MTLRRREFELAVITLIVLASWSATAAGKAVCPASCVHAQWGPAESAAQVAGPHSRRVHEEVLDPFPESARLREERLVSFGPGTASRSGYDLEQYPLHPTLHGAETFYAVTGIFDAPTDGSDLPRIHRVSEATAGFHEGARTSSATPTATGNKPIESPPSGAESGAASPEARRATLSALAGPTQRGASLAALALIAIAAVLALAIGLFSRIARERILDLPRRRAVYDFVVANPGSNVTTVARATRLSRMAADYHLRRLVSENLLVSTLHAGRPRYSPPGNAGAVAATAATSAPVAQRILETVRSHPGIRHADLARAVGASRSLVTYHAKRLVGAGLLVPDGTDEARTFSATV